MFWFEHYKSRPCAVRKRSLLHPCLGISRRAQLSTGLLVFDGARGWFLVASPSPPSCRGHSCPPSFSPCIQLAPKWSHLARLRAIGLQHRDPSCSSLLPLCPNQKVPVEAHGHAKCVNVALASQTVKGRARAVRGSSLHFCYKNGCWHKRSVL